ncbi:potassium channel family protein [Ferrimonas pelagia]|uniref:Ion transporter n=1 Tax=Ferrimonas pelagia TaxID=1177826 RepID=A0ABP9FH10_9GAMM
MKQHPESELTPKELGMMALSLLAVAVVLAIAFSDPSAETTRVLMVVDLVICLIFISHFFYGLLRADDRKTYFRQHWIDLVASIPAIEPLRYARIFQILRVFRLIKMSRSVLIPILRQKQETTLTSLMLAMLTIITLASVLILLVEEGEPGANIDSAEAAIWWALITISTVGYGDYYPVTLGGRIISAVVIITGVSFFGVVAGYLASVFVSQDSAEEHDKLSQLERQQAALLDEIRALRQQLARNDQRGDTPTHSESDDSS